MSGSPSTSPRTAELPLPSPGLRAATRASLRVFQRVSAPLHMTVPLPARPSTGLPCHLLRDAFPLAPCLLPFVPRPVPPAELRQCRSQSSRPTRTPRVVSNRTNPSADPSMPMPCGLQDLQPKAAATARSPGARNKSVRSLAPGKAPGPLRAQTRAHGERRAALARPPPPLQLPERLRPSSPNKQPTCRPPEARSRPGAAQHPGRGPDRVRIPSASPHNPPWSFNTPGARAHWRRGSTSSLRAERRLPAP